MPTNNPKNIAVIAVIVVVLVVSGVFVWKQIQAMQPNAVYQNADFDKMERSKGSPVMERFRQKGVVKKENSGSH